MNRGSPLQSLHERSGATLVYYGTVEAGAAVVETFGELGAEYAAIRKGCGLLDLPTRSIIEVRGGDRHTFLNRMVTQELKGITPFEWRPSFWLNRKGRIDADLRVIELGEVTLLEVDVLAAARVVETLGAFIIADDVELRDVSAGFCRLALHGPSGPEVIAAASTPSAGAPVPDLPQRSACEVMIGASRIPIFRDDETGDPGLHLIVPERDAVDVYRALLAAGMSDAQAEPHTGHRLRRIGWHAFNMARIEAGTPLANIDFGPDSLPAETGVLRDRVSFRKGCYLGQEIVARMDALGKPKKQLVGIRVAGSGQADQPVTGAAVFGAPGRRAGSSPPDEAKPIGAVTSSARSPMLGDAIICFAQVATDHTAAGTSVEVACDSGRAAGEVQPGLAFWMRERTAAT